MRSEAWRPAAAARNRSPREARDPALQALRPGCEELAVTDPAQMPVREARPRVKNRHGGAPRGERPASWDARRLASAWRIASKARSRASLTHMIRPTGASHAPERLSALRPPLDSGSVKQRCKTPGAKCAAGRRRCVCVLEIMRPGMEDSESAEKQENTGTRNRAMPTAA